MADIIMIGTALVWLAFVAALIIWTALEAVERKLFYPEVKRPDSAPLGRSQKSGRKASYREARN